MLFRILFLAAITLHLTACIATPRLFSKVSEDYEPPKQTPEITEQEKIVEQGNIQRQLTHREREEIRNVVREELRLQNRAMPAPPPTITP